MNATIFSVIFFAGIAYSLVGAMVLSVLDAKTRGAVDVFRAPDMLTLIVWPLAVPLALFSVWRRRRRRRQAKRLTPAEMMRRRATDFRRSAR